MAYQILPRRGITCFQRIASGDDATEGDVLRDALRALTEQTDDLAAVQAAVTGLRAGEDGQPLECISEESSAIEVTEAMQHLPVLR